MKSKPLELTQFLLLNSLFCLALYVLRISITGSIYYGFLIWNLFLAYIPYFISFGISKTHWLKRQSLVLIAVLGVWLLFLPNAPYLITDLMHLQYTTVSKQSWIDPFMLFVFAWNGLFVGLLSMYHFYVIISEKWNRKLAKRFMFFIAFLCGFGIYLGRYLRWNSWEFFSDPFNLLADCLYSIYSPVARVKSLGITVGFGIFLSILFLQIVSFFSTKKNSRNCDTL